MKVEKYKMNRLIVTFYLRKLSYAKFIFACVESYLVAIVQYNVVFLYSKFWVSGIFSITYESLFYNSSSKGNKITFVNISLSTKKSIDTHYINM